jgi:hypothetical protein
MRPAKRASTPAARADEGARFVGRPLPHRSRPRCSAPAPPQAKLHSLARVFAAWLLRVFPVLGTIG